MKRLFIPLLILLIATPLIAATPFTSPVKRVILDAGHGGEDPGAVGSLSKEKEITLAVTKLLAKELTEGGLEVMLTRESDTFLSLEERVSIASGENPGVGHSLLFVSIHANSSTSPQAQGFEVLIKKSGHWVHFLEATSSDWQIGRYATATASQLNTALNRQNLLLATAVNHSIARYYPEMSNRGVKEQDVWVLNGSKNPSVLVEMGFISNPLEEKLMLEGGWQAKMASAIAEGLFDYISGY